MWHDAKQSTHSNHSLVPASALIVMRTTAERCHHLHVMDENTDAQEVCTARWCVRKREDATLGPGNACLPTAQCPLDYNDSNPLGSPQCGGIPHLLPHMFTRSFLGFSLHRNPYCFILTPKLLHDRASVSHSELVSATVPFAHAPPDPPAACASATLFLNHVSPPSHGASFCSDALINILAGLLHLHSLVLCLALLLFFFCHGTKQYLNVEHLAMASLCPSR